MAQLAHHHPFAELIGLHVAESRSGHSVMRLEAAEPHLNPHGVVHGAVMYAMADTGMGAALYPTLGAGEICATVEIKMSYFKPVQRGEIRCTTELVHRGRTMAHLVSRVEQNGALVGMADGNYAIFTPRAKG